ncbi:hypothetical protein [Seohaeicola zhoushanensis]|uniref:Uncharacterized protein n=1 Tax=Seohaeicola zhoushanensis TaxID=1569283 RepID=A0A8J3GYB3_9RHOB|nr:hypothetical protein [Seohaeicola zhoushanensis]GHF51864.1 hypothetical protein GCM10017056_24620 [Seohaeicola zhoushanensis]
MLRHLETQRRVLVLTIQRYQEADRDWSAAAREARSWFPGARRGMAVVIGSPGSRVRKLYDRREKALQQLAVARRNLDEAKARLARRHRVMLLLTEG